MNWTDGPATHKQLKFLDRQGFKQERPLTKTEAAELIRRFGGRPEDLELPSYTEPHAHDAGHAPHDFRAAVENARRQLSEATAQTVSKCQQTLAATVARRLQFWQDTCRETNQMQLGSKNVMELHQKHGCIFCTPSQVQTQEILDALDSAMPFWDRDRPELFFQTLSLNFPGLKRCM